MDWKNDNYVLSIDSYDIDEFNYLVSCLADEPCAEIWDSKRISDFRYHIHIKTSVDTGVHLKYWHNAQVGTNYGLHKLQIKFNFNKVRDSELFDWLCDVVLYKHLDHLRVSSVDMCTDIKSPITSFIVDKGRKKNARSYNGTLYFGDRGRNGAVKIYDKGKEQKSDEVLTRFEITIKPLDLTGSMRLLSKEFVAQYSVPDVLVLDTWQLGLQVDPLLKASVLCVLNGDMNINEFSYYYRKKIKDFMSNMKSFNIDDSSISDINKAMLSEIGVLIEYIRIVHDVRTFCKNNDMPF